MIQPLRATHRSAFLFLGVSLPVLFVAAISSRGLNPLGPVPVHNKSTIVRPIGEIYFQAAGQRISLQLNQIAGSTTSGSYVLSQKESFPAPELLLYWSASNASDSMRTDAILIGQLVPGQKFSAPDGSGNLLLYDAPHKRLLASFPLGRR